MGEAAVHKKKSSSKHGFLRAELNIYPSNNKMNCAGLIIFFSITVIDVQLYKKNMALEFLG